MFNIISKGGVAGIWTKHMNVFFFFNFITLIIKNFLPNDYPIVELQVEKVEMVITASHAVPLSPPKTRVSGGHNPVNDLAPLCPHIAAVWRDESACSDNLILMLPTCREV